MPKKTKAKLPNPATAKYVALASLSAARYDPTLSYKERGQLEAYLKNKGLEELPEMFEVGSVGYNQFNYTPQQKRGGKIPKEVLGE